MSVTDTYIEVVYKQLRRSKMYQENLRTLQLNVNELLHALIDVKINTVKLRFFYTRWDELDSAKDLLDNYPEKFLTALIRYIFTNNYPITIMNVFCDANTWIYDVKIGPSDDNFLLRTILQEILTEAPVSFSSHVEVVVTDQHNHLFEFRLDGFKQLEYSYTLFTKSKSSKPINYPPVKIDMPVSYKTLDKYYLLLRTNYSTFYTDVKNRYCTCWCIREGIGDFIIKRYVNDQSIRFPSSFDLAEPLLQTERITQIVPNCLPFTHDIPIELCIDVDVPKTMDYLIVKQVTDTFASWLKKLGLFYLRRLTGNLHGGQHFILPLYWPKASILNSKGEVWEVYVRRTIPQILCDSVHALGILVSLLFQKNYPSLARYITTHIFDPYIRHQRLLFDLSPNAWNRGRRSILSLHHSSQNVCVPYNKDELPVKIEDYLNLCSLDLLLAQQTAITEPVITKEIIHTNSAILAELVSQHDRLFIDYGSSNVRRFEAQFFDIPLEENYEYDRSQ